MPCRKQPPMPLWVLFACALLTPWFLARAAAAGEDPTPPQVVNPWYGPGSPFVFSEGDHGEKLVKIGNLEYWILTSEKLATDPNPGLMRRNVAVVGNLGKMDINPAERYWKLELANDKTVFTHGTNAYEENLDMVKGLRIGYEVMLVGQAKPTPDQKGSILVVTKPYRIPPELERDQAFFNHKLKTGPDYEIFKRLADDLEIKATTARARNDEHLAGQFHTLRDQVINELITLRGAVLEGGQLSVDEMFEYMTTILKYNDDRPRAAEVLKRIMKKAPHNPKILEPQASLLIDYTLCSESDSWMPKVECEKLRQAKLAEIERIRQEIIKANNAKMAGLAMNSNLRHVVVLKNQALITNSANKLPVAGSAAFQDLAKTLNTSDDYRLVQELMLQAVAQLDAKEWVRLIEPALTNKSIPVRLLAYRLGAYSKDIATVRRLALALRTDTSEMLKEDAVMAMCETRAKTTVLGLADCLVNSNDDALNAALLSQLQRLTNRRDTDKDAWQQYVADPAKIVVAPE